MNLPISTERLVLRSFRDADLDDFLAYRNDPDVARLQSWEDMSRDTAAAFLRQNTQSSLGRPGQWQQIAIALDPGDDLIGDIGLFLRDDGRSAELGFTLAGRHQGRGLAREAMAGLIDTLFGRPGLERLEAVTDERNESANALLARLGFVIQSTAAAVFKGMDCREHTYTLSRKAWFAVTPGPAPLPLACDLGALSPEQRSREQALLAEFKTTFRNPQETAQGFRVVVSAEPGFLARLGEFLALERLCCPFLMFDLSIPAGREPTTLHVHGGPGTKPFLRSVFFA